MDILTFIGTTKWLSNFHRAEFVWDGIIWPTTEHAYQAAKTLDRQERLRFSRMEKPGEARREGQLIPLREDWEEVKLQVMYEVVLAKFKQNPDLRGLLINTGGAYLEEGNNHGDRFWGVCPPYSDNGLNHLGQILMRVREELK